MKFYRRFIRLDGELIPSPRFAKKKDAEEWYHGMRRNKQFVRDGLIAPDNGDGITFIEYARPWMKRRMVNYPAATWKSDEQRLRDYILPIISEIPIANITGVNIRHLLLEISKEGFLDPGFTISVSTRDRVKALLSVIFSDALNEDPPVVKFNPVLGIKIKDKRRGKKKPRVLADSDQCLRFIEAAKEIGWNHYVIACTFLMTGLRKQELIALRWENVDFKNKRITVGEKYEQASNTLRPGTKRGEDDDRPVYISKMLIKILEEHFDRSGHHHANNFVFSHNGTHLMPRKVWEMIAEVRRKAKVDISPHGLRHTFGREFAANTGNIKALQATLGHASSSTTDLYSELAGNRLKPFGEAVTFDNGVKQSE